MVTFTLTVDWSWTPAAIKRVKKTSHKKPSKSSASPAVSPRSIWSLSAALQWARLAESYLTISCSIHERAIMYKRVSKACERAPRFAWRAPAKLFCPRGMKDVEKKNVFLLEKHKKQSPWSPLTPFLLTSSLTSLFQSICKWTCYVSAAWQATLLMHGGHFVPRWLAIGSRRPALARRCWFCCWSGLSVTTGQQQRGKRGEDRGGGPAVPTSALPSQRRRWDGPDSTTQNRTRLERTRYGRNLCWFQCSVWGFAASLRQ